MRSTRDTGERSYRRGRSAFIPEQQRLALGSELSGRHVVTADACVIGSGAGGAVVAKELAEGGMRVVVLEQGRWISTDEFNARPRDMLPALYMDGGRTFALGQPMLVVPVGQGVGGTTLVNSGSCLRPPAAVLERWQREDGLAALTAEELDPYFRRVERELNVSRVPESLAGRNAHVIRRGAERLGWSGGYMYRNVRGCMASGVCQYGCPTGAKQHTGITYIPRAWAAGAVTFTGVRATGIDIRSGRVRSVTAKTIRGGSLRVRCGLVVVAGGALQTPALLRRFGSRSSSLGRHLSLHPASAVQARMNEQVSAWEGVPQSFYVDEFADDGVMLEGIAGPPDYLAMAAQRTGPAHREVMLRARQYSSLGVMVSDSPNGRVRMIGQRPLIRYSVTRDDARRLKRGFLAAAELYWAAGAEEVLVPVAGVPTLRAGNSGPLERHPVPPASLRAMGFHPLGTARAGADPKRSVVDPELAVRGIAGLYVADGSAVPGPLGVNPQITIMALATRLAYRLLGAAPPENEPFPSHIA